MNYRMDDSGSLVHYGTPRHSGRYPWGSGKDPYQSSVGFLTYVKEMRAKGMSQTEIARALGMTTTEFRARNSIAKNTKRVNEIAAVEKLRDKGHGPSAIGKILGMPESTVRSLLEPGAKDRADILQSVTAELRDAADSGIYVDIGAGTERHMNISRERLKTAVAVLKEEGYQEMYLNVDQLATGHQTKMVVLVPPGTDYSEMIRNQDRIGHIRAYSEDGGRTYTKFQKPISVDSKRLDVVYGPDGGELADGVVYVRPGVSDLDLGKSQYAQVRIAIDGTHYIKGMAVYKDDLPAGVDLQFNTNKDRTANKLDALKPMKSDPDAPFGSLVRQIHRRDSEGNLILDSKGQPQLKSAMNLVNEEGDWDDWGRNLATQMLSKQSEGLATRQLNKTFEAKQKEFEEIKNLSNPSVRKTLLAEFADNTDSSATHMKAKSINRQATQVIMPVNSLKPTEVYAPNFRDGERVVLIRYPHGGIFEIPELTVNNNHRPAKKLLGPQPKDAIGINAQVAQQLSGADFDGDTVLVIPNNNRQIRTHPSLESLKTFDPQRRYPGNENTQKMRATQTEMGKISNLVTDMTIKGADFSEIAAAVRHSMVVIDAEKHGLDYKQSEIDNGIANLKKKYQREEGSTSTGAATLISRANAEKRIPQRKPRPAADGGAIDPKTGERHWVPTGATRTTRTGETVPVIEKIPRLSDERDAHALSSGTRIETIYANHSNRLKSLANEARREMVNTRVTPYNASAAKAYRSEVDTLTAKLNTALKNAPLERQANLMGGLAYRAKLKSNPDMDNAEKKKAKFRALEEARANTNAKKQAIEITPNEWAAIQAGAVSPSRLEDILRHANPKTVRELATPRASVGIPAATMARARGMLRNGESWADIADALGVSITALRTELNGG